MHIKDYGILVTGATGFVGRNLVNFFREDGYKVWCLSRRKDVNQLEDKYYIDWNLGQNRNITEFDLKPGDIQSIVHLAANCNFNSTNEDLFHDNVVGTAELLKLAEYLQVKSVVYFSSVGIYSSKENLTINENSKICCNSVYHMTKLWGEDLFRLFATSNPFVCTTIFRMSSPIGVGMRKNFLSTIIENAIKEEDIFLFGSGSRIQNYIDVRDVSNAVQMSLKQRITGTYNLVSDKSYSNFEIANYCKSLLQSKSKIHFIGKDEHEDERWIFDSSSLNKKFGFSCRYGIDDSIKWLASNYADSCF